MRRVLVLVVLAFGVWAAFRIGRRPDGVPVASTPRAIPVHREPTAVTGAAARLETLARDIPADAISPLARELNAPDGTIQRDLEILNQVFVAWQTNFPRTGNPVGENEEITLSLAGDNPLHFAFIAPTNPAINDRGQLVDRWGTPFRFHQLSGTEMELRSAGPDKKFATADDVQFAPGRNPP
jgi:hypothetical protein